MVAIERKHRRRRHFRRLLNALGPGLTTGAADDDPSGIATYSQAGAQFGFALTWTVFLTLPCMTAIQLISACIGWETRSGLARNIALQLPSFALFFLVGSLVVANTINIAADLAAMGEALRLAQAKDRIQSKWDKLTKDDLELIAGRRERLEAKIRHLYGFSPDHVSKEVDDWLRWQVVFGPRGQRQLGRSRSALASTR